MYYSSMLVNRRKVFISYYHGDQVAVNKFINDFSDAFIAKAIGVKDGDFDIESSDPTYIMRRIRETKLEDSTVTIVLMGDCTHSRRYVDWEIKASLQQGESTPNGLIGILLPYKGKSAYLPPRFNSNWSEDGKGYAQFYAYPKTTQELKEWIEDAFASRTNRCKIIRNSNEMMKYNQKCLVHDVTHPAG